MEWTIVSITLSHVMSVYGLLRVCVECNCWESFYCIPLLSVHLVWLYCTCEHVLSKLHHVTSMLQSHW